jgi:hypothetical protein
MILVAAAVLAAVVGAVAVDTEGGFFFTVFPSGERQFPFSETHGALAFVGPDGDDLRGLGPWERARGGHQVPSVS